MENITQKLTLEHLAPYLPYGLKVLDKQDVDTREYNIEYVKDENTYTLSIGTLNGTLSKSFRYPILRPMSDLYKQILIDGLEIIPLISLACLGSYSSEPKFWSVDPKNFKAKHESGLIFYLSTDKSFVLKESEKWKDFGIAANQFNLFKKLYEWHFDVFGLIEKGLAISIHDVNPL